MIATSFKDTKEVMAFPPTWIPSKAKIFYYNLKTGKPQLVDQLREKVRDLYDVYGRNAVLTQLRGFDASFGIQRNVAMGKVDEASRTRADKSIQMLDKFLKNEIFSFEKEKRVTEEFIRRSLNKFIANVRKDSSRLKEKFSQLVPFASIISSGVDQTENLKESLLSFDKGLMNLDFTGNDIDIAAVTGELNRLSEFLSPYAPDRNALASGMQNCHATLKLINDAPSWRGAYVWVLLLTVLAFSAYFGTSHLLETRMVDEEEGINLTKAIKFLLPKMAFLLLIIPAYYIIGHEQFGKLMVNYSKAWYKNNFDRYFFNSFYIAVVTTFFQIFTSALAAYAFAFMEFRGKNTVFMLFLATMMIPAQAILVPNYLILAQFGWIDTYWALIFPFCAAVFGIFLLRQFFMAVPRELFDAATIDGCSKFGFFWRILIPLSIPAVTTMGIFTFIGSWNSFLWALIVTHKDSLRTIQVGLSTFNDAEGTKFELLMAASTFCILPLVIGFFLAQKQFIEGISRSGMKG
jgi:ABC-type glycerol-3-phosphate transport system permease component